MSFAEIYGVNILVSVEYEWGSGLRSFMSSMAERNVSYLHVISRINVSTETVELVDAVVQFNHSGAVTGMFQKLVTILWLLATPLFVSPGYQQPWY